MIGCEEVGKALTLVLAGPGKVPDANLPKALSDLRRGRRSHQNKQAISLVAWLVGDMLGKRRPAIRRALRGRVGESSLPPSFHGFVELFAEEIRRLVPTIMRVTDRHVGDWSRLNDVVSDVAAGSWQRVRDHALYVDIRDDELREPKSIGRAETLALVNRLGVVLRGFRPLASLEKWPGITATAFGGALPDREELEQMWRDLVESQAICPRQVRRQRIGSGKRG